MCGWHLLLIAVLVGESVHYLPSVQGGTWHTECPRECACYTSKFSELSVYKWLDNDPSDPAEAYLLHNELEDKKEDDDQELKTATCILEKGADYILLTHIIPKDVQALSLLQAPDAGFIALDSQHFQHFPNVTFLEIQGYKHNGLRHMSGHHSNRVKEHEIHLDRTQKEEEEEEEDEKPGKVTIKDGAFRDLNSLQYLNLQYVTFKSMQNKSDVKLENRTAGHYEVQEKVGHKLVFIKQDEEEVVPYLVYKSDQQKKERAIATTFAEMKSLKFLRIYACRMKELDWEMFEGLGQLTFLSLERNKLKFLPDFAFFGTPNLKTLSVAHNKLIHLHSAGLAGLLHLEKLDLSHNEISVLSELSLPPLPKVKWVDFHGNPIEAVYPGTFLVVNATEWLHLGSKVQPIELHHSSFSGMDSLRHLTVTNVKIAVLEREILQGMPSLKALVFHGSVWKVFYDAFVDLPKLETLDLSHCGVKKLSMDAFVGLNRLTKLDLSHNKLVALPPGLFDDLMTLRELWLQWNDLSRIPKGLFRNVPAKLIRLQGNPWHCSCDLFDLRPTAVNKVRQQLGNRTVRYNYSKRVAPLCHTPKKFRQWSIFDVMRKELRCGHVRKVEKQLKNKMNAKALESVSKRAFVSTESTKSTSDKVEDKYVVYDKNQQPLKLSKKAWKLEQERKRLAHLNKLE